LSTTIAQVQIEASRRPIITSFTTQPACQNSDQIDNCTPGSARGRFSIQ
jgi:hypothetical protein